MILADIAVEDISCFCKGFAAFLFAILDNQKDSHVEFT